jgi:hypothetical protein
MKAIRIHVETEDEMDDAELQRLNEALASGLQAVRAGNFRSAADGIADLRKR